MLLLFEYTKNNTYVILLVQRVEIVMTDPFKNPMLLAARVGDSSEISRLLTAPTQPHLISHALATAALHGHADLSHKTSVRKI